jgi:translation elongation factor EF-1alpha
MAAFENDVTTINAETAELAKRSHRRDTEDTEAAATGDVIRVAAKATKSRNLKQGFVVSWFRGFVAMCTA